MALPIKTPTGFIQVPNAGFESGAGGWTTSGSAAVVNDPQMFGAWCVKAGPAVDPNDGNVQLTSAMPVVPGQSITLTLACQMTTGSPGTSVSADLLWTNASGGIIATTQGAEVNRAAIGSNKGTASVTGIAPAGAAGVKANADLNVTNVSSTLFVDNFSWNYNFQAEANLSQPGTAYTDVDEVPFRVSITGLPDGVTITQVEYFFMEWDGSDYINPTSLSVQTTDPYAYNAPAFTDGQYGGYAIVTLSTGLQLTSNSRVFVVGATPPADEREYKASNSLTYLIGENFFGLESAIPSTALVTGAEIVLDYSMDVISRAKDVGIDAAASTAAVIFDIVNSGTVEAVLLDKNGSDYTTSGTAMTQTVPVVLSDFTIDEEGISEGKKWTFYSKDTSATATIGAETLLFGQASIDAPTFFDQSIGLRFIPNLGAKPSYADTGDGAVRFKVDTFKVRVFFDAGSVEYYFASPDKSNVIKGELVSAATLEGNLATGDASGVLQLSPELEVMLGSGDEINNNWTIHSAYPPTDNNQIGIVAQDMEYNGLQMYYDIDNARSRYMFITANFYGDPKLDSIYGANGVGRAFAYNGEDFYKIYTQPDAEKDKPRHVANHLSHLALGYGEGRVDLSVVGEPYNFDGSKGASSWAIGDNVTGLLPLSGSMLGIFCKKSVVGLAGSTVDNFSTQIISAKLGAVEYTATDMGFPVYANAYGIYTLEQTSSYGDFLGNPLSQPVSPWLRPRLVRKAISDKEVVVAWPVRSKNQYKLAFADGYVLTMTMNYGTQTAPTFSKQKYFLFPDVVVGDVLEQASIVPAAISSELDDGGEERIHIANKVPAVVPIPPDPPEDPVQYKLISYTSSNNSTLYGALPIIRLGDFCAFDARIVSNNLDHWDCGIVDDYTEFTFVRGGLYTCDETPIRAFDTGNHESYTYISYNRQVYDSNDMVSSSVALTTDEAHTNYLTLKPVSSVASGSYLYKAVFTHPDYEGEIFAAGSIEVSA